MYKTVANMPAAEKIRAVLTLCAISQLHRAKLQKDTVRKKRLWMTKWKMQRYVMAESGFHLYNEIEENDGVKYYQMFRMYKNSFYDILGQIEPQISK